MGEEPSERISKDALTFYKKLSRDISQNRIYRIKEFSDDELNFLSNKIKLNFLQNYNTIFSVYSYIDKLQIEISNPKIKKEILKDQENPQESFELLNGNIKIIISYLNTHKVNLTYEILKDNIYINESNTFDKYSVNFNKSSKLIRKSQVIDLSKDHEKFVDFLIKDDIIESIYFCFRCEYISNKDESWNFQKRREIAKLLPLDTPDEYFDYIYKIINPYLDGHAKNLYKKLPKKYDFEIEEIKNILFFYVINKSLKNQNALLLFEHVENDAEFKSFIISILIRQSKVFNFIRPFLKISKKEVLDEIIEHREKESNRVQSLENSVIDKIKVEEIFKCLFSAAKEIKNINRRKIIILYLRGYSLFDIYEQVFSNMNRNTFDSHKYRGIKDVREKCSKLYREWR